MPRTNVSDLDPTRWHVVMRRHDNDESVTHLGSYETYTGAAEILQFTHERFESLKYDKAARILTIIWPSQATYEARLAEVQYTTNPLTEETVR